MTARVITALIALVISPIALGLLASGGLQWRFLTMAYGAGLDIDGLLVAGIQIAVGILLLIGIVVTGIWSSAGLLTAGALALVPLVLTLAPALMMGLYRLFSSILPREWLDGLLTGIPLLILPVLGGLGLALMMLRRHPGPVSLGSAIAGLIGVPLLLALGGWALAFGISTVFRVVVQQFRFETPPLAVLAILGGTALVVAALFAVRWSPYALAVTGLVLVAMNAVLLTAGPRAIIPAVQILGREPAEMTMQWMYAWVLLAIGLIYLSFTLTAAVVRRRRQRASAELPSGHMPGAVASANTAAGPVSDSPWQRP